ncbi:hypothetical protein P7K49_005031, partial [Saguinus oedipus]
AGFVKFNSEQDIKAMKEAMESGDIDGHKITLGWANPKEKVAWVVMAEEALKAKVDFVAEAGEALKGKEAS